MLNKKTLVISMSVLLVLFIVRWMDLDDRVWYYFQDLTTSEETKRHSVWLPSYEADITEVLIPGVTENASGITYDYDNQTLWVIVNGPPLLLELDLQFNVLRRFELKNFKDPEGVTYAGKRRLLLTDERDQTIVLAKVDSQTKHIDRNELQQISLNVNGYGNKGLEGIAIDRSTNTIYAVRERDPMKLFKINGFIENKNHINIRNSDEVEVTSLYLDDLSGLHYDANTKHLLILSDESKLLAEVDLEGNKVSYMELVKGFNSLSKTIPQAEGVTMDDQGHLYIVSEPNMIYRYSKVAE